MRRTIVLSVVMALAVLSLGAILAVALISGSSSGDVAALVPSQQPVAAWVTDGEIHAVAQAGGKIFAAGPFTRVTSWTGGLARTDLTTGTLIPGTPGIEGEVSAIVSDGSGGWYIGGEFVRSEDGTCPNLVHIVEPGRIDPQFCPRVEPVVAIALAGGRLYVASDPRGNVAERLIAVDLKTGASLDWVLDADGGYDDSADQDRNTLGPGIHALASDGETLYVGGFFDALGRQSRTHLAALDGRTGELLPWRPRIEGQGDAYSPTDAASGEEIPYPRAYVGALAVGGGAIYAGGSFDLVDGAPRASLAAFELDGGGVTDWAPKNRALRGGVEAIAVADDTVAIAAGRFRDGTSVLRFAASSNSPAEWARAIDSRVNGLAFGRDGDIVAVGDFTRVGRTARSRAAMLAPDGRVTAWEPVPTSTVSAVVADGRTVLLGGAFSGLGGSPRDGLAAFEARSGALLPWSPSVDDVTYRDEIDASNAPTYELAATDEHLYVFGDFSAINGASRDRLAAFAVGDGRLADWSPGVVPKGVTSAAITAGGDRVYLAFGIFVDHDFFTSATAVTSAGDVVWATPDSWDVDTNDLVLAGGELWLGGDSAPYLQALDADSGALKDQEAPRFGSEGYDHPWIDELAVLGGVVYAAGVFDAVDGFPRPGLAAFDDGALTDWVPRLAGEFDVDTVDGVSASAGHVYIYGDAPLSFTAVAGQARAGNAALSADTAAPIDWPPKGIVEYGRAVAGSDAVVVIGGYLSSETPTLAIFPLQPVGATD